MWKNKGPRVVFDLDGTLFTSEAILCDAYRESIDSLNDRRGTAYVAPGVEKILAQVGRPVWEIFRALFPEMTDDERREAADGVLARLDTLIRAGRGRLYDGVKEMLAECASEFDLYLVSNCRRIYLAAVAETYELAPSFVDIRCNEDEPALGKKGILKRWIDSCSTENAVRGVMIGDRFSDGEAAEYAGIPWIGCRYGYAVDDRATNELNSATLVVGSVEEIFSAVRNILGE